LGAPGRELPSGGDADFRRALRQLASAVAVITTRSGEIRDGQTATAVCSVAADPAMMLISLSRRATMERTIADTGVFAVNYLTEAQHRVGRLFSTPELGPEERFAAARWDVLETGAPILNCALASFDCLVQQRISAGTHSVFLGAVVASTFLDEDCLIYRDGFFRRLAPIG
jgi:flavin reductase (DIM6/NTAB) family NADH-FMN oxidoreductase RutF